MARMLLAFWRCKCGTRVKVVAEEDSSSLSRQIASCPKCREPHDILANKIISVMEDTSEGNSAAVPCKKKERLFVAQNKAFDIYRRLVSELAKAPEMMAHAEFEFLANRVCAARHFWQDTRQQLNEHTARHGC